MDHMDDFERPKHKEDDQKFADLLSGESQKFEELEHLVDFNADSDQSQQSGLISTTRPLVTSLDDDNLICDFGDKSPTEKKTSLLDMDFELGDQPLARPTLAHHVDDDTPLSIGAEIEARPHGADDSASAARNLLLSSEDNISSWGAAVSSSKEASDKKDQQADIKGPPQHEEQKTDLPKIGSTNPVSDDSRFSTACEYIAHTTSCSKEKKSSSGIAMEGDLKSDSECCAFSPAVWFNPEKLNPTVANYVYWRDVKKSGIIFGTTLFLLLSLKFFSLISVVAYMTLTVLLITISFRIYKNILQAVQKSNEGHPFKEYLDMDIALSHDKLKDVSEGLIHHVNAVANKLRSLILVEDLIDTLKLVFGAWCLTYIGSWFNGMTVIILAFVTAFTLPKVYELNKTQIDAYADIIITKGKEVMAMVNSKIPLGKKKKDE